MVSTTKTKRTEDDTKNAALGGLIAGLTGAVALWIVLLIENGSQGRGFWSTFKSAALPFFGERVMQPGFDAGPFVVGVIDHLVIGCAWGVLFGLVCYGAMSKGWTVISGLVLGIVVWLAMLYVVLPIVGVGSAARSMPVGVAIFNHLVYGLVVGVAFLPYQKALPRQIVRPAHTAT